MFVDFGTKFHFRRGGYDRTEIVMVEVVTRAHDMKYQLGQKRSLQASIRFCRHLGLQDVVDEVLKAKGKRA